VLERIGVLARTWQVTGGEIRSTSTLVDIGASTEVVLIGANAITIAVIGLFAHALAASRQTARHALEIQAWHMRALVPDDVPGSSAALPVAR
jgi:hypothetical protein